MASSLTLMGCGSGTAAAPPPAGIALVSHVQVLQTNTSSAIDTTGATFLVAHGGGLAANTHGVPSDSKGNTWVALTDQTGGNSGNFGNIYYVVNPTVGSGHTFTGNAGSVGLTQIAAFSGVNTVAPFDTGKQNGFSTTVSLSSIASGGGFTPSVNNALIIAGVTSANASAVIGPSGFTVTDSLPLGGGVNYEGAMAYAVQTTATATDPAWSWVNGLTTDGCTKVAAFIP